MASLPIILSTWSFGQRANYAAFPILADGGSAIDAVEHACVITDADPTVDSVGYGGLPDRSGRVSLDGCIMLGPAQCGSACMVRRHMHPVSVARRVMERTPHIMLAGEGADEFADAQGFASANLLAPQAAEAYQQWLRDKPVIDQSRDRGYLAPRPVDSPDQRGGRLFASEERWHGHDTIGVLAIDSHGTLAGACSTSGMPYKVPGRVGDSPIIGHGLYVDPQVGAAVATGSGELIMGVCGSFLAVERMRQGASPAEALEHVLARIASSYTLRAEHQVALIALKPDGAWHAMSLRAGYYTSVRTPHRDEVVASGVLLAE